MPADHDHKLPLSEQVLPCPCDCCGKRAATEVVFDWLLLCGECAEVVRRVRKSDVTA